MCFAIAAAGGCGGAGDQTIDITHDACEGVALVAPALTDAQSRAIAGALELWRVHGLPMEGGAQIEIRFQEAAPAFYGVYDDETGVIYINQRITDPGALRIVIAHELGHAFGLPHVTGRPSLMNPANVSIPPTAEDAAALQALWGPCPAPGGEAAPVATEH